MESRTRNDEAYDVAYSTDWLSTPLSPLMHVEEAFRCQVCKDFYTSPMLTSCNHTFCSLCIRRALAADGKCPLCRAGDQESKLRGNWALREAVDAFTKARKALLEVARTPQQLEDTIPASPPKRSSSQMEDIEDGNDVNSSKRPRMSTRSSRTKGAEATAAIMRAEVGAPENRDQMDYEPADGLVACPICWARMKPMQVDRHIDTSCPGSPQPESSTSQAPLRDNLSSPGPRPAFAISSRATASQATTRPLERLPALNYSIIRDQALRKKMSELGISTSGPRGLLERRHKEWMTIWNANCDSAHPKTRTELLRDLDTWERTLGGRAIVAQASLRGPQITDKDFDGKGWAEKHADGFKSLAALARQTRNKATRKTKTTSEEGADSGGASGGAKVEEEPKVESSRPEVGAGDVPVAREQVTIDLSGSSPIRRAPPPFINPSSTTTAVDQPPQLQPFRPEELAKGPAGYSGQGLP